MYKKGTKKEVAIFYISIPNSVWGSFRVEAKPVTVCGEDCFVLYIEEAWVVYHATYGIKIAESPTSQQGAVDKARRELKKNPCISNVNN